jgi:predicted ATPase/class 3 adenylate cyclase
VPYHRPMPTLPVGDVTFLLTDIEGSTRLVHELGSEFKPVLERHHAILRRAIDDNRGLEVSTEGDAFFAVFQSAADAVGAAVSGQRALAAETWPTGVSVLVRMGLHTGEAVLGGDNYMGVDVHRAARIAGAAHGGQVLMSETTRALVDGHLADGVGLRDLGRHRLKDLPEPEHLHQLVIAGLRDGFPAPRSADVTPTNIVSPPTALVGRDRELSELEEFLASTRLLTLTGPGGTGKTRLATELGARAAGRFRDGVFLVPLETFEERSPAAGEIGQTIGARLPGQRDPEDNLVEYVAEREIALVLDNLEQLAAAGELVSRLLASAPGLRVVATSRIPLHVSGEQEYPVPPLEVPGVDGIANLDDLARVEAVALFVDRARRAKPDFRLTASEAAAVAAICRRLDGLPLAIELAAARVKIFSPTALLGRLDHALPLLGTGNVDVPARQRTLRAAIEWSCTLLGPSEQALFRRLTVFSGGWTVDAADEVVAPGELGIDVVDGLTSLVDHSLVRTLPDDSSGDTRFDMLQLIREYGAERLAETDDDQIVGRRHADWILRLTASAAPIIEMGRDPAWLDRLAREHDNIRAALRWAIASGDLEIGLRIAAATWRFWQQRGHNREGREWFDRLWPADADASQIAPEVMADAHTAIGGLAYWQDRLDEAEAHYRAAHDLDRQLDRTDRIGNDIYNLGFISMFNRDLDGARRLFDESAALFTAAGQLERLADTTIVRGAVEMRAENYEDARTWTLEGRKLHLEQGNQTRATDGAMVLSYIHLALDDLPATTAWLRTAVDETIEAGYVARWPLIFDVGVALNLKRQRPLDALRLAGASSRRRTALGGGAPTFFINREEVLADARRAAIEQFGEAAADQAWSEGEVLDQDALIALIIG